MKIQIGQVFNYRDRPIDAFYVEGIGTLEIKEDIEEPPFKCIELNRKQLLKFKKIIDKELAMKGKVNPYNKREDKDSKKAFAKTEKSVASVAKDTNKTKRNMKKPTKGKDC